MAKKAIKVYVTEEEYQYLQKAAAKYEQSMSEFMFQMVDRMLDLDDYVDEDSKSQ